MARVPLVDRSAMTEGDFDGGNPSPMDRLLAWRPGLSARFRCDEELLQTDSQLGALLHETAVMSVVRRSPYETRRNMKRAIAAGLTSDMLEAIAEEDWTESSFSEAQKAVVRFAMLYDAGHGVNEPAFASVKTQLSVPQIVELAAVCSHYGGVARLAIGLALDPES